MPTQRSSVSDLGDGCKACRNEADNRRIARRSLFGSEA